MRPAIRRFESLTLGWSMVALQPTQQYSLLLANVAGKVTIGLAS